MEAINKAELIVITLTGMIAIILIGAAIISNHKNLK